ncbi:MAG TPA: hypothetical protein VNE38_20835 [Ktedonobacteraceae bacterium]|nr:hypothetical protein [Ktedonobacteraceae bacterium]
MNLWAESDNKELASAPVGQTAKPGTARRSPTEQALLPALRAWLLAEYVAPYCRSLAATRIFRRCFWIDAVGGTRKAAQKDRAEILPPALQAVATLAGDLARESRPITLQGIALDNGKHVGTRFIASVASSPDAFVLPKESSVINAGWREAAPSLLPAIEQAAAIFLLNLCAVAKLSSSQGNEIPFLTGDDFAPLFQRSAPTELCLLLMHRQVETILLPALRTTAGAAAFTALLRSDRWKALLALESEDTPAMARVDRAIDLLQAALQPHFLFVQRIAFPMVIGPATVEDAPCALLFATRRQDSLVYMNDAVCGYRRRSEEESRRGLLNETWFVAQQAARDTQALQQLRADTLREGRARAPRRWPDLRQQLLVERFGQWMLRDYDDVICHLLQAGEVRCEWRQPGGGATSDSQRVPGNEDILLWQDKKRRY